ncbi:MAG: DUF814 domain-containing protein [Candidatus Latescibacterota bacterium]|nr:MAG: DUF814 domain-containing protein [Candidatus Latescibacterota bacterium]
MNAPFLSRLAPALQAVLAGKRLRYALARSPFEPAAPVLLLRMEPPAGTLVLSLRRDAPGLALLAEGEAPEGEKDPRAARLAEIVGERALARVVAPSVDRSVRIDWDGGIAMRLDLLPSRPALYLTAAGRLLLALPEGVARGGEEGPPPLPGAERPDLVRFDPETIPAEIASEEEVRAFLRGAVRALPAEWSEEVLIRSYFKDLPATERRSALIGAWKDLVREHAEGRAAYAREERGRIHLSSVRLLSGGGAAVEFASPIDAAASWWRRSDDEARLGAARRRLRSALNGERKRLRRLTEALRADLAGAERAPLRRKQAEILSIHFRDVEKGASSVRLPDPYDGGEIEIPLDPTESARRNIERLFQLARKGERGAEVVRARLADAEKRARAIEALAAEAERAAGAEEAEAVLERARPLLRAEEKKPAWREKVRKGKDVEPSARPRSYVVSGGYTVLVGRDDKENDLLTLKIARPGDLWFHAEQAAGSHVVLLRDDPKKPVPKEALLEAAAIAARYSKAKHASKVPVIYTEKRYVRKPRGWPPGKVTCEREKMLFVEPGLPEDQDSGGR